MNQLVKVAIDMWSYLQQLKSIPLYLKFFALLLILLPLHAIIVTIAPVEGLADVIVRSWKEVFLIMLTLGLVPSAYRQKIWRDPLVILICVYAILHLVYVAFSWSGPSSMVGLRNNLSFLLLYVLGLICAKQYPPFKELFSKLVIALGATMAVSALLQTVLPEGWYEFTLIGVGGNVSVIQDSDIVRFHGFLSGPLQLGSYLILPIAFAQQYYKKHQFATRSYVALLMTAVFLTYSRAALVAGVGVVVLMWLLTQKAISKRLVFGGLGIASTIMIGLLVLALQWQPLSLLVFHAEPDKALTESSTADHLEYSYKAAQELAQDPLGDGPGTAGPASAFGSKVVLTENYFLQIGLEVGVVGLILFIVIVVMVGLRLWQLKETTLFVSFIALTGMNLLLHTWTDTATAWTWWLCAGLASGLMLRDTHPASVGHTSAKKT